MKIEVRYHSRGGNTQKLARAIADAVGCASLNTTAPLNEDTDVLFLGSSVYAGGVDEQIRQFVQNITVNVGTVVCFGTAAMSKSAYNQVKKLLDEKNITLADKEFFCKGSFLLLNKGRPNENDCKAAAAFAADVVKNMGSR